MKKFKFQNSKRKSFISIFAIFFSAIVVSVLVGMFSLLVRQIQILNIDATSFQAYYVSDSTFECFISYEKKATSTRSYLLPNNYTNFPGCSSAGDTVPKQVPTVSSGRANSVWNYSVVISGTSYCGVAVSDRDGSTGQNSQAPNSLIFSGQSKSCSDTSNAKIIERGIDFYY